MDGGCHNFNPPGKTPPPATASPTIGGSPALLTSTGGLYGVNPLLLVPFYNNTSNKYSVNIYNTNSFNSEEDCQYDFPVEDIVIGRNINISKVIIVYRDFGKVQFTLSCTTYSAKLDTFNTVSRQYMIGGKNDNKLHTTKCDFVTVGERPQLSILRKAGQGNLSLVSVTMVGHSSEEQQV